MLEPGTTGPATAIGAPHGLPSTDAAFYNAVDLPRAGLRRHAHRLDRPRQRRDRARRARRRRGRGRDGGRPARRDRRRQRGRHPSGHGRGPALPQRRLPPDRASSACSAPPRRRRGSCGLDAATTRQALGIAGSLAAGILENLADGSSTKRLHPGFAAPPGILAARLAAHGETGPATVIEGRFGALQRLPPARRPRHRRPARRPGRAVGDAEHRLQALSRRATSCTPPLDSAAEATAGGVDADEIEEIVAFAPADVVPIVLEPLADKHAPRSEYDAKFSLPYSVASYLVHGKVDVMTYVGDAIRDPRVLDARAARALRDEGLPDVRQGVPRGRPGRRCATAACSRPSSRTSGAARRTRSPTTRCARSTPQRRARARRDRRRRARGGRPRGRGPARARRLRSAEPRSRARSRHGVRRPGRSRICSMNERPRCQARLTATCQGRAPSPLR